ncbi:hypothetical protein BDZ45DRAFT_807386 [Acephala macrosclerotiorum]|nr:hypothetical protein BDZ45DRAFT_807386 [Acephala macrosclerotiorum]
MATIDDGFKQVLDDFKKRLKPEEQTRFAMTTLVDLQKAASDIQERQRRSKTAQNLARIQPFLQVMSQYTEIIEVFLNTSSMLCFVWGPMKFILMTACNLSKAFDVLLDAYKQIAEAFPLLLKYRSMFEKNDHMKKVLVWMYEDILKFHLRAWRVFSQPDKLRQLSAPWLDRKTVLASVLIEACSKIVHSVDNLSLAFFYCRDKDEERNTFASVAKAMLVQLLRQNPTILPFLYDECLKMAKPTLSTSEDCIKLLSTVFQIAPQILIILDGIDECVQKERSKMLKFFTSNTINAGHPGKVRCLFISQELSDIKGALHPAHTIRLAKEDSERDIRNFTVEWALEIQQHFKLPDWDKERIIELVCVGAEGMFLYARLVLQNLRDQESLDYVYKELHHDTFPGGFEQAYERIVSRIMRNPNLVQRKTARKLLGWVAFSKRPLKWHEIQGATSIDLQNRNVNFQIRQMPLNVRDICGSLVEILPGDRVQLVHKTAREQVIH